MSVNQQVSIGFVDDHTLFRKGLISLIKMINDSYQIIFEADNGNDLKGKINENNLPEIILMDINMPYMDGFAAVKWLKEVHPSVKVIVVSMIDKEESILRMVKLGVKGYISKEVEPEVLSEALLAVKNNGFYYTDYITGKLLNGLGIESPATKKLNPAIEIFKNLQPKEVDFLKWASTDLTYNDIALRMFTSPKTIDGYRDILFKKLQVKSRVGLALYAVKNGLVDL